MSPSAILFGAGWTFVTALAAGSLLLRAAKTRFSWPFAFILGASLLSFAVTIVALLGVAYKGVFLALGAVTLGAVIATRADRWVDPIRVETRWFWAGYAPFTLLYLANAMAPEMSPDGMAYHLGLVQRYAREHRLMAVPENMYAGLSQGVEMLFLHAFTFGRHSAAAMVHFCCLFTLPLAMADFGSRTGRGFAGAAAGLLVYATPIVGVDGISAYVDVAVAGVWFALFVLLERRDPAAGWLGGTLAGFAFAAKYTAVTAVFYLIWKLRRDFRQLATALGVAAVFAAPWLLRNWISLDNPFAPFFNSWFPNPHQTPAFEAEYAAHLRHYELTGWWDWAEQLFLKGQKTGGFLGPAWLLAPLGFAQPAWLFAAATYPLNVGARFLIPALPLLAWGMTRALGRFRWLTAILLSAHLVSSWPVHFRVYASDWAWNLEKIPWKQALRIESEESYLNFKRGEYRVARMIEDFVPPGERVFSFSPLAQSYTTREIVVSSYSTHGIRLRDIFLTPVLNYFWPTWRHTLSLREPARRIRLTQTAANASDMWSVSEVEPKPAAIRVSAGAYSAHFAMDRNPMTRWTTGHRLRPGDWMELEYPTPVSTVTLWLTRDQWNVRWRIEPEAVAVDDQLEPQSDLRRWSTETIRSLGIRYFTVDRLDAGFDDFGNHEKEWNIVRLAERGSARLYRME